MTANFIIEVVKSVFGISSTEEPAQPESAEQDADVTIEREAGEPDVAEDTAAESVVDEGESVEEDVEEPDAEDVEEIVESDEEVAEEESTDEHAEDEPAEEVPEEELEETETDSESADEASPAVGEINGIGPTYSERLTAAGIETVADLAAADAESVAAAAEVSETRATDWIEQASEF